MKNEAFIYCFDTVPILAVQSMLYFVRVMVIYLLFFLMRRFLGGESQHERSRGGAV